MVKAYYLCFINALLCSKTFKKNIIHRKMRPLRVCPRSHTVINRKFSPECFSSQNMKRTSYSSFPQSMFPKKRGLVSLPWSRKFIDKWYCTYLGERIIFIPSCQRFLEVPLGKNHNHNLCFPSTFGHPPQTFSSDTCQHFTFCDVCGSVRYCSLVKNNLFV